MIGRVQGLDEARITRIACGHFHMMALQEDGNIWAWGLGEDGRLGAGKETSHDRPVKVLTRNFRKESPVVKIFCGGSHSLALTDDGQLYTWGRGEEGQLGLPRIAAGSLKHPAVWQPTKVQTLSGKQIFQVACGANHTAALIVTGARFVKQSSDGIFHRLYYGEVRP